MKKCEDKAVYEKKAEAVVAATWIIGLIAVMIIMVCTLGVSGCFVEDDEWPDDDCDTDFNDDVWDDAGPDDWSDTSGLQFDNCYRLRKISGEWFDPEEAFMDVTMESVERTCRVYFDGPGAFFSGLFEGIKLPLHRNVDGGDTEFVTLLSTLKPILWQGYGGC